MRDEHPFDDLLVLIKGAGDLATGVAWRLHRCGIPVVMTELPLPLTVRRAVAFAQAVYDEEHEVEDVTARKALAADVPDVLDAGEVPVLVDEEMEAIDELAPSVVVDAVVAKVNTGTTLECAEFVAALGPGFEAGVDCHAVIETNRGPNLGRAIWEGAAEDDTGTPGAIRTPPTGQESEDGCDAGSTEDVAAERVLRAPVGGHFRPLACIGDHVEKGAPYGAVVQASGEETTLLAPFSGVLRGLIHESVALQPGLKIGDIDPRGEPAHAFRISDKSLAVGGGVLEAFLHWHFGRSDDSVTEELGF
ncbi:MAG: selenium-dependent molybdenum cofactor biosynthesis protein YqeB [Caldilineaceae bacterium]|nr:selenium-dependent molybdenum cofactor biosynthesis protein YqeB [Caldilineaceae bacterium]MDE0338295.1 selenium-dependent molybdenum cofactor biosynthesis protein YqeB [Caldilineaceae bacterium]